MQLAFKNSIDCGYIDTVDNAWKEAKSDASSMVFASFVQEYSLNAALFTYLEQPYSESMFMYLEQPFSGMDVLFNSVSQYYGNTPLLLRTSQQPYGDTTELFSKTEQPYSLNAGLFTTLKQPYGSLYPVGILTHSQPYDLLAYDLIFTSVTQPYSLAGELTVDDVEFWVTIDGLPVETISADYNYSLDAYCGDFTIELAEYSQWLNADTKQAVQVYINGTTHNLLVVAKSSNLSVSSSSYPLECKSPAVLLDFPFATEVPEDFIVSGNASDVVSDLAALEGLAISWEMASDPPLTGASLNLEGNSPLSGIRQIVNDLGGRVQSHPDGSIHAVPRHSVDSDKYHLETPTLEFTTGLNFITLGSQISKRRGFNKYEVSDDQDADYNLDSEKITESKYKISATKVPWVSTEPPLTTSELTNISIVSKGAINETHEEEIELVGGQGTVQKPCYGGITWKYREGVTERVDLGDIEITEEGVVTSAVEGDSMVEVTYTTRYWSWEVSGSDAEKVQFILGDV